MGFIGSVFLYLNNRQDNLPLRYAQQAAFITKIHLAR